MAADRQTLAVLVLAAAALALGGWLRFALLPATPLHADEATGARLVGYALDGGGKAFDPTHFHGPMLHGIGTATSRLAGATGWSDLRIGPLRAVTAASGLALCLLPLAAMRALGRVPAFCAAAFLALSPPLVHFSRVYIHESLLALLLGATLVAAAAWWRRPSAWLAAAVGGLLALAAANKETFVITAASWVVAAVVLRAAPSAAKRMTLRHAAIALGVFLLVLWFAYSDFGRNPAGIIDFARTYWSYEVTPGHEKPPGYYARLLLLPHAHGRLWLWSGGAFLLALVGCLPGRGARPIRFLLLAALAQLGVYSLIAYKTPWLMVVPWAHVVAAAGLASARVLAAASLPVRIAGAAAALLLLVGDAVQSHRAAFRFPSDPRNPFCYVPTATGIERWTRRSVAWVRDAGLAEETVAVVGPHYWPLPWYLKSLPRVGYWGELPESAEAMPLLVAMPQISVAVAERLAVSHTVLPEGLRADTPVLVFIRNDLWEAAMTDPAP